MLDLSTIAPATLLARGEYATVRSAHEDAKKSLSILCGQLGATSAQVLRKMQPDHDVAPDGVAVADLLALCRATVDQIEETAARIDGLARQRAELKPIAWGRV